MLEADKGKSHLAVKHDEIDKLRRTVDSLELQKKGDARKLSDAERALESQKKSREAAEEKVQAAKSRFAAQEKEWQARIHTLEGTIKRSGDDVVDREELEQEFEGQVQGVRAMLERAVEEYSRLAASSVPAAQHHKLKMERARLELRVARLERKLGDREAQVTELAAMIRQAAERRTLLESSLADVESDLMTATKELTALHASASLPNRDELEDLHIALGDINANARLMLTAELEVQRNTAIEKLLSTQFDTLLDFQTELNQLSKLECKRTEILLSHAVDVEQELEAMRTELISVRTARTDIQVQLVAKESELEDVRAGAKSLESKVAALENQFRAEKKQLEGVVQEERERNRRLNSTMTKCKMSEQGLQADIES